MTRLLAEETELAKETELAEKLQSIYDFFQKEEFMNLPLDQRTLLNAQYSAMTTTCLLILHNHIALLQK